MRRGIVHPFEHRIFERKTTLMRKVVPPEQRHDFPQAVAVLGRHQQGTLVGKRIMQTDSQMTFTLVQETFQPLAQSDGRHRDAFRAPGIAIIGRQNLRGAQHVIQIVQRLSLSHKYHIGQGFAFRQRIQLVQDIGWHCPEKPCFPVMQKRQFILHPT